MHDDEISIFELFQIVWKNKYQIILITALFSISSILYHSYKKSIFRSEITYEINIIPPFTNTAGVRQDIRNLFYSENYFIKWKNNNPNSKLEFSAFNYKKYIDGNIINKETSELLASINYNPKSERSFIRIVTKDLNLLNDFYLYFKSINNVLKNKYSIRSKEEVKMVEKRWENALYNERIIPIVLNINRFILTIEKGKDILEITPPTFPKKVYPRTKLMAVLYSLVGFIFSIIFVFTRHFFLLYKDKKEV